MFLPLDLLFGCKLMVWVFFSLYQQSSSVLSHVSYIPHLSICLCPSRSRLAVISPLLGDGRSRAQRIRHMTPRTRPARISPQNQPFALQKKAGNVLDLVKINRLHYKKRLEMCLIWSKSTVCITKKAGNLLDLVKINSLHYKKGWKSAWFGQNQQFALQKKAGNVLDLV